MNKAELVKVEGRFEPEVLRVLKEVPGVEVQRLRGKPGDRADVIVRFGGKKELAIIEFKRHANAGAARQLVEYARHLGKAHLILVAGETTAEAREILTANGIGVIDGIGNAHLELPGLLFHIEMKRPREGEPRGPQGATRLTGKAGVVAQAMLLQPDRRWKVQDVAAEAETSAAFAHRVLARLDREGLTETIGAGPRRVRRLVNSAGLLDLWVEENRDRAVERTFVYRLARDPKQLAGQVSKMLSTADIDHAVTGAAAATRVAPFVTAVPVTDVWVTARVVVDDAVAAVGGEVVETGNNLVLAQSPGDAPLAFRHKTDGLWMVNPMRLYYDLRRDPRRGREQAERVREKVIGL